MRTKKIVQNSATLILSVVILCIVLEVSLRLYRKVIWGINEGGIPFFARLDFNVKDPLLGWKGSELMGDISSKKPKIFCVGDSYTQGGIVLNHGYNGVLARKLDAEVFAYGAGGHGTLQEYLVIDKYIEKIKPNLVILQVCGNDFINNYWVLEKKSYFNNNYTARPYYEDGKINYRFPRENIFIRKYIVPHSRLVYTVLYQIDKLMATLAHKKIIKSVEDDIFAKDLALPEFKKSVAITSKLIRKIKAKCDSNNSLLISFPVDDVEPYFSRFKQIFKTNGIGFIEEIPYVIKRAEGLGCGLRDVPGSKSHWNKKGHFICGVHIARYLKSRNIIGRADGL